MVESLSMNVIVMVQDEEPMMRLGRMDVEAVTMTTKERELKERLMALYTVLMKRNIDWRNNSEMEISPAVA